MARRSRQSLLLFATLAAFACGTQPPDAPDAGHDAGEQRPALAIEAIALEPVSPTVARLVVESNRPARLKLSLAPAAAGPFDLAPGAATPTAFNLKPGAQYTLTAVAEDDGERAEATASATMPAARTFRVLFDRAHGEAGIGEADWAIDDDAGAPKPANPRSEKDWKGALSSWGFALHTTGRYELESLGSGGVLTFGGSGAQDLSKFDVLVLAEPNNWGDLGRSPKNPERGRAERDAIVRFVKAGGGLIAIADHTGSDRDGDGADSVRILRPLLQALDAGIDFLSGGVYGETTNIVRTDPLAVGPFGAMSALAMYEGALLTVSPREARRVRVVAYKTGVDPASSLANSWVYAAAAEIGEGRVVVYGDSSAAGDGTGARNTPDKAAWTSSTHSHPAFFLNATAWTAGEY